MSTAKAPSAPSGRICEKTVADDIFRKVITLFERTKKCKKGLFLIIRKINSQMNCKHLRLE